MTTFKGQMAREGAQVLYAAARREAPIYRANSKSPRRKGGGLKSSHLIKKLPNNDYMVVAKARYAQFVHLGTKRPTPKNPWMTRAIAKNKRQIANAMFNRLRNVASMRKTG